MNAQEIFDKAYKGVIAQGKASVGEDGFSCLYRAPDGSKCAFGHLIPDKLYAPTMEDLRARAVIDRWKPLGKLFGEHTTLIGDMQSAHDAAVRKVRVLTHEDEPDMSFLELFRLNMKSIAERHKLTIPMDV